MQSSSACSRQWVFRCLTVGRNLSLPDQVDDTIRQIMQRVDCLIGIATVRFDAADRSLPNQTLRLASPYLLEETAMAHQRRIPFLISKTPEVSLQGVTGRNLYLEVSPRLRNGRPAFYSTKPVVRSALEALRKQSLDGRAARDRDEFVVGIGKLSTLGRWGICRRQSIGVVLSPELLRRFLLSSAGMCPLQLNPIAK